MNKLILTVLIAVNLCFLLNKVVIGQYPDPFAPTELSHPLLTKVFPGLHLEKKRIIGDDVTAYEIYTDYKGEKWYMPSQFNLLASQLKDEATATAAEYLEAFLVLYYWNMGQEIRVLSGKTISLEIYGRHFNWLFETEIVPEERPEIRLRVEIIIAFDGRQIIEVRSQRIQDIPDEKRIYPQTYNPKWLER